MTNAGLCRMRPPNVFVTCDNMGDATINTLWPEVLTSDACMQHPDNRHLMEPRRVDAVAQS